MDAIAWQLLLLELALVVVLAVLSASEAAINIARRPGVIDELTLRGRRGQRICRQVFHRPGRAWKRLNRRARQ